MSRKFLMFLLSLCVGTLCLAGIVACSPKTVQHTHVLTKRDAVSATCTEAGKIAYWECEGCGKIFSDAEGNSELAPLDVVILPSGHTLGNWIVDEEPTCAQEGSRHKDCTSCGAVLERGAISKTDHVLVIDQGIEPTCTSMGKTDGIHCSACNKVLLAQKSIPKLDHTPGEWIVDREATCVREGSRHTECEECGSVLKTETLEKLPHSYVDRVCENCGALDYSKGLEFKSNYNGTYTLEGIGTCSDEKVIVPDTYNGKPVAEIGREAFSGCLQITHLILPDSIVKIGASAFENCSALCSVVFSDVTESIGMKAFANCSLQTLRIPDSVTSIEAGAFSDCTDLTSVVLSSSLDCQTFEENISWQSEVLTLMRETVRIQESDSGKELLTSSLLQKIWYLMYENLETDLAGRRMDTSVSSQARVQLMMQYIHQNLASGISLRDIADQALVSKSTALNLFAGICIQHRWTT